MQRLRSRRPRHRRRDVPPGAAAVLVYDAQAASCRTSRTGRRSSSGSARSSTPPARRMSPCSTSATFVAAPDPPRGRCAAHGDGLAAQGPGAGRDQRVPAGRCPHRHRRRTRPRRRGAGVRQARHVRARRHAAEVALRDRGVTTLVLVGAVLEIGIEPTARHAADLGLPPGRRGGRVRDRRAGRGAALARLPWTTHCCRTGRRPPRWWRPSASHYGSQPTRPRRAA